MALIFLGKNMLKGEFGYFDVGFCEVLKPGQCITSVHIYIHFKCTLCF